MTTIRRFMIGGLLGASASLLAPPAVPAQSLGYVLMPSAQRIQWDDALALEDDWMFGGRLGLLFGRHVELQPFYYTRNSFPLDKSRAQSVFGPASQGRTLDMRHFGTNLQLNLGRGDLVPFIRAGGSILRLEPDSGERRDRVAVAAGGGVRFTLGGLQAELFAEQMAFRLNPLDVFGTDTSSGALSPTQRNIVYGAAFSLPLSRASDNQASDDGLRGSTAPLEPFVGRLRYASSQGLDDQELAGIRAGIDFSPQVGLRGFYWRGVNDDRDGTAPVVGYGGEAQFNLNTGPGLSPYLVVGAGRVDYRDAFRDPLGNTREDQGVLIVGGGVSLRMSDRLRLNASVRDYVMTPGDKLQDVSTTDELTHNPMISAGLTISLGGHSAPSRAEAERARARTQAERDRERDRARDLEWERDRRDMMRPDRRDTTAEGRPIMEQDREPVDDRTQRVERVVRIQDGRVISESIVAAPHMMPGDSMRVRVGTSGQWMTIPVPVVGEVILRYGMTPSSALPSTSTTGLTLDELRRVIREEVQRDSDATRGQRPPGADTPAAAPPVTTTDEALVARLADMERRLAARIEAVETARLQTQQPVVTTPVAPMVVGDTTREAMVARDPLFQRFGQMKTRDLRPFIGLGGGDGTEFVTSLRADLGPLTPGSGFRFVPELALGFGSGSSSLLAMANVQYPFTAIGGSNSIRPYVTAGAGIFSPSVLAVNTALGATMNIRGNSAMPLYTYVEVQGLNLFNYTRFMVGLSSRR